MIWPFVPTDRRILDLRRKLAGMTAVATQLRADKAKLSDANDTLRALVERYREIGVERLAAVDRLEAALRERDAELLDTQGQLADARERLAFIDREEDMRDEVRAKRASDL